MGLADSMWIGVDDQAEQAWHTLQQASWGPADDSPSFSVAAGVHEVKLYVREDGFKFKDVADRAHAGAHGVPDPDVPRAGAERVAVAEPKRIAIRSPERRPELGAVDDAVVCAVRKPDVRAVVLALAELPLRVRGRVRVRELPGGVSRVERPLGPLRRVSARPPRGVFRHAR